MSESLPPQPPEQVGRMSQIVVGALILGQVIFGVVAVIVRGDKPSEVGVMTFMGVGFAGLILIVSMIIPNQTARSHVRQIAEVNPEDWRPSLAGVFLTMIFIRNGLLEGAGIINGIAYIIHGHRMSLALIGVIVAFMAITFPSQSQFESWAEQVQRDHS